MNIKKNTPLLTVWVFFLAADPGSATPVGLSAKVTRNTNGKHDGRLLVAHAVLSQALLVGVGSLDCSAIVSHSVGWKANDEQTKKTHIPVAICQNRSVFCDLPPAVLAPKIS